MVTHLWLFQSIWGFSASAVGGGDRLRRRVDAEAREADDLCASLVLGKTSCQPTAVSIPQEDTGLPLRQRVTDTKYKHRNFLTKTGSLITRRFNYFVHQFFVEYIHVQLLNIVHHICTFVVIHYPWLLLLV